MKKTKIHLLNYIESGTDSNKALFVSLNKSYNRLTKSGVELSLWENTYQIKKISGGIVKFEVF